MSIEEVSDSLEPEPEAEPRDPALESAIRVAEALRTEIRKVVVGQDRVVDEILIAFFAGGHVLIEGVPGLGKTLLVLALSRTFGGSFARIQFTPDLMPSDITGHAIYEMGSGQFRVRKGPVFTNLLLADEINRAPAKTQAALLEVMQEQRVSIENESHDVPRPFMTLATQNPIEQEGTYPLPEAQLDRFLLKVLIDYPQEREEIDLVRSVIQGRVGDSLEVSAIEKVSDPAQLLEIQNTVSRILVDERVHEYAVKIVRETRRFGGLVMGAGPRGAIALLRAAKAKALLEGRDHVTPDDIKELAAPCLRHRVVVAPELELEGHGPDFVLQSLLDSLDVPRT